jgi:hypothetical protein
VGDPFDGIRGLDAGPVGVTAAEQQQTHRQCEARQDFDFDGRKNGDFTIDVRLRPK